MVKFWIPKTISIYFLGVLMQTKAKQFYFNFIANFVIFKNILPLCVFILFTLASCNNGDSNSPQNTSVTLTAIAITPESATINLEGGSQQFNAIGIFSNNTSSDITESVIWSSDNESIAIVNNESGSQGFTIGTGIGTTNIKATIGDLIASSTITITPIPLLAINVTPTNQTIPDGITQKYTATGYYEDGSTHDITRTAMWSSSATNIASINSKGIASGISPGNSTITAFLNNISGSANLEISSAVLTSIVITPTNQSLPIHSTQQYIATGVFSDQSLINLTNDVIWSSSNRSTAIINETGLATAIGIGFSTISADFSSISGTTILKVN